MTRAKRFSILFGIVGFALDVILIAGYTPLTQSIGVHAVQVATQYLILPVGLAMAVWSPGSQTGGSHTGAMVQVFALFMLNPVVYAAAGWVVGRWVTGIRSVAIGLVAGIVGEIGLHDRLQMVEARESQAARSYFLFESARQSQGLYGPDKLSKLIELAISLGATDEALLALAQLERHVVQMRKGEDQLWGCTRDVLLHCAVRERWKDFDDVAGRAMVRVRTSEEKEMVAGWILTDEHGRRHGKGFAGR